MEIYEKISLVFHRMRNISDRRCGDTLNRYFWFSSTFCLKIIPYEIMYVENTVQSEEKYMTV
jgi:hypothetical protein